MRSIISEINKVKVEGILLIVSNPVDVLTHVALKESGLPKNRVIGSGTVLDTARLKYLISQHLHVDTRNVHGLIMGEHGDSEFAAWSITNISGVPLNEFCEIRGYKNHEEGMRKLYEEVRDAAYKIIEKKGATYYGIAIAVDYICRAIVNNSHTMLTISTELEGEYGLSGLSLSVPTLVGIHGVEKVLEINLSKDEKENFIKYFTDLTTVSSKQIEAIGISRQLLKYHVKLGHIRTVPYGKQKRYLLEDILKIKK
jgi:L-lactate dehydrogenase